MSYLDQMNQTIHRMKECEPRIPSWAKLEKMEISTPQVELWKFADEPKRGIINTLSGRLCKAAENLLFRLSHRKSGNDKE